LVLAVQANQVAHKAMTVTIACLARSLLLAAAAVVKLVLVATMVAQVAAAAVGLFFWVLVVLAQQIRVLLAVMVKQVRRQVQVVAVAALA
jgi:hypothetical protein